MSSAGEAVKPVGDPEKRVHPGEDSSCSSDSEETAEKPTQNVDDDPGRDERGSIDEPHQHDLESQRSRISVRRDSSGIQRVQTGASTKSRLSRIATALSRRSKKEKIPNDPIPTSDLSRGLIGWESQEDPDNPLNFTPKKKWLLLSLISAITLISPLASSMFAPAVSFMDKEFHNNNDIISALTVSIFVLGYVIGPLALSPLSEIFGRRPVLTAANVFFCVWQIGCALAPDITSLIIFRFLAGLGGSGCLTIGGGVIADLFHREQRGMATAFYSAGPLFGPVIGPICGGFIGQRAGWRWVFWVLLIAASCITIGIEILNRETNHRVLIKRKTDRLRIELNRPDLQSVYTPDGPLPASKLLKNGLLRPLRMIFLSPIVFILCLYMSVVYGLLYLLFTTITGVFINTYGWAPELCGLAYMGIGLGFFSALIVVARLSDATIVKMTKANNDVFEPEMRLPACVFFACFIPITFFWYGWSADKGVHWIVSILGLAPFGFGMIGIFMPIQTYLIDAFPEFAASSLAALTASRSLFGALLPLAAPSMYAKLGLGWGNSTLGFIAIALIPAPALIYKFGGKIRKDHPIKL